MRLNRVGKIIAYDKVRGRKNAVRETVRTMNAHVRSGADYNGKRFICHSNCPDAALETRAAVQAAFPHIEGEIRICDIGAIIASHCGPGTVAVFFLGDERPEERKDGVRIRLSARHKSAPSSKQQCRRRGANFVSDIYLFRMSMNSLPVMVSFSSRNAAS